MRHRQFWIILGITAALSFLSGTVSGLGDWAGFARARQALYAVDGDTIKLGTQSLRLENADAPETRDPACEAERVLGLKATERVRAMLGAGGVSIEPNGRLDRYGRPLVRVRINGADLGEALITEGLAHAWGGRGADWCG